MTLLTYQVFKTVTEQGSFEKRRICLGLRHRQSAMRYLHWRQNLVLRIKPREKRCDAYQLWRAASSLCKCSFEQR